MWTYRHSSGPAGRFGGYGDELSSYPYNPRDSYLSYSPSSSERRPRSFDYDNGWGGCPGSGSHGYVCQHWQMLLHTRHCLDLLSLQLRLSLRDDRHYEGYMGRHGGFRGLYERC